MKRILAISLVIASLTPFVAHAQTRMSDARYLSASRCLAYADVAALQPTAGDFDALRAATVVGYRDASIVTHAREDARSIRAGASSLVDQGSRGMATLQQHRQDACANFVGEGLVRLETSTPPA